MTSRQVVGLVLAAGEGRRLGRPKALVETDGQTWLARAVQALRDGGVADVRVVVGAAAAEVAALLPGESRVVEAVDWREGMGASLRAGLADVALAAAQPDAVIVMLVDTLGVSAGVVRRVSALAAPGVLARAAYDGRAGHPVLLGRDHWEGVALLARGDEGARAYLRSHPVALVECGDLGNGEDIDTAEQLAAHHRGAVSAEGGVGESVGIGHPGSVHPDPAGQLDAAGPREPAAPVAMPGSAAELGTLLAGTGYLSDDGLATIGYLALAMHRPLLLEGEPGTGKTALAEALAQALGLSLIRLQCHEGIDASQALYDWDFARQILHLRTVEATKGEGPLDSAEVENSLFDERFLLARPIVQALRESPVVLLVDEIDRADDEFEAFLLEVLSTNQVTIPEFGTITATVAPIVILTSNRTREVHDALKRRCLYHWVDHPGLQREIEIVRRRLPEVSARLAEQVAQASTRLRGRGDLVKPPGVAETLDWALALHTLGASDLDLETAAVTLGAVLKYREDAERVRTSLDAVLSR